MSAPVKFYFLGLDKRPRRPHIPLTMKTLRQTADAIIQNADDFHKSKISFELFDRFAKMLWESVHRSQHDALTAILASKGFKP